MLVKQLILPVTLIFLLVGIWSKAYGLIAGDINQDGTVNIQDFTLLSQAFGSTSSGADLNGDGVVNLLDFTILSNNFGKVEPTPTSSATPIPPTPTKTPTPVPPTPTTVPNPTITLAPSISPANVYWRGDAETGDLSQWCNAHAVSADRIQVVTTPRKQGNYAYRFELRDGDSIFSTERVVLSQGAPPCGNPLEVEGEEKYYGFSVYLPTNFPAYSTWAQVMQFKAEHTGSPPVQLALSYDDWRVTYRPTASSSNTVAWKTPAVRGRWERFVYHIKWSRNPQVGFIEVWYNGTKVVPKFFTSTVHEVDGQPVPAHAVIGHYRDSAISSDIVLYHDGYIVGSTYEAVAQ